MAVKTFYNSKMQDAVAAMWPDFIGSIKNLAAHRQELWLAVSPGSSTAAFYDHWLEHTKDIDRVTWKKLRFCLADERLVPITSPDSNYYQMLRGFFQPLYQKGLIDLCQTIGINYLASDIALEYSCRAKQPQVVVLGVGEDGHTASLFPRHSLLAVTSNEYLELTDSPKPPSERITLPKNRIKESELCLIFFNGGNKAQAYKAFQDDSVTVESCPAKLALTAKNTYIVSNISARQAV